jgi:hypothetical protein
VQNGIPGHTYLEGKERLVSVPASLLQNVSEDTSGLEDPSVEGCGEGEDPGEFTPQVVPAIGGKREREYRNEAESKHRNEVKTESSASQPGNSDRSGREILQQGRRRVTIGLRHQILYHSTYRVPAMALRAYQLDGTPLVSNIFLNANCTLKRHAYCRYVCCLS